MLPTISVKIPEELLKKIDKLVEEEYFTSRSEIVRYALHLFLREWDKIKKKIEERAYVF